MLVFDNGAQAGWGPLLPGLPVGINGNTRRDYARVLEFNPVTLKIVWQYSQPNPTADYDEDGIIAGNDRQFFSGFISGAQRLKNGNTLITEGGSGRIFEVTRAGKVVWEFISPFRGGNTGLGFLGRTSVYRSYRIPYRWVPRYLLHKDCPEPEPVAETEVEG